MFEVGQVALRRVRVGYPRGAFVTIGRGRRAVLEGTPVVGEAIMGNAIQPRGEGRIGLPVGAGGNHPLPDFLEEFVSQGRVTQLTQQETVQAGAVAGIQLLERSHVPGRVGQHQGFVGRFGKIVHRCKRKAWARIRIATRWPLARLRYVASGD